MKSQSSQKSILAICAWTVLILSGCGGGDSGQPTPTPTAAASAANACNMSSPVFLTCPDTLVLQPAALQEPQASNYAASSNELAFFTELNIMRTAMGLGPLHHHTALDKSSANHAAYLNASWVPGENFHVEFSGRVGFTGASHFDRMKFAGYPIVNGSETGSPDTGKQAFYILADTVYHRQAMMDESLTHVGMISTPLNGTITNYAYKLPQRNSSNFVGIYPVDGQTGVSLNHYLEEPNPFPELEMTLENMCTKTGFPISLQTSSSTVLTVNSFTLLEVGQSLTVPVRLLENKSDQRIRQNFAFIVAHAGLKPNTQYEVKFTGVAMRNGSNELLNITKTWRFTTDSKTLLVGCRQN